MVSDAEVILKRKMLLIGLHFLPGVIFSLVLFTVMPKIAETQLDLFLVQVFLVFVFLLGLELLIAKIFCQTVEKTNLKSALTISGATTFNTKIFSTALAWGLMSAVTMKVYLYFAGPLIERFRDLPFLSLPAWHYQNLEMPAYPPAFKIGLLVCMLGFNVFAEEIYFRAFLMERLKFLGKSAFLVNGVLFILYHIFQARISYPLVPFGILISGYYAIFRNVWGAMLIHLILNLALSF
jgi:hypothetical protein